MFSITNFILFLKQCVERLSMLVEMVVWYGRNTIMRSFVLILFTPLALYCLACILRDLDKGKSGLAVIAGVVILTELSVRLFNRFNRESSKRPLASILDRMMAIVTYIYSSIEVGAVLCNRLVEFIQYYPGYCDPYLQTVQLYAMIPFQSTGLPPIVIFLVLFFGVGRNHTIFPFIVRYHVVQALLTQALFYFNSHLFTLFTERRPTPDEFSTQVALIMYAFMMTTYAIMAVTAVLGIQSRLPFMHDAVIYHVDRQDADSNGR